MTTMQQVALRAGVSTKTVSRVYNDDPHVDPSTRAKVAAALDELNYVPNSLARNFRTGRSPAIGVAIPDIADPFFASIARAVEDRAHAEGMAVMVASLGDRPEDERPTVESLLSRQLSALVIAPTGGDHRYLARWTDRTPVVFADRGPSGLTADSFVNDDDAAAELATSHLIGHGHRRIAFVGDTAALPTTRQRLAGYFRALRTAGIEPDDGLVVLGVNDRPDAERAATALMASADPPTAVFSSNARTSMVWLFVTRQRGLTGLACVSFGDFPMADALSPAVTVIDQNPYQLGARAADRALARMRQPRGRLRRSNIVRTSFVERESCLPRQR